MKHATFISVIVVLFGTELLITACNAASASRHLRKVTMIFEVNWSKSIQNNKILAPLLGLIYYIFFLGKSDPTWWTEKWSAS